MKQRIVRVKVYYLEQLIAERLYVAETLLEARRMHHKRCPEYNNSELKNVYEYFEPTEEYLAAYAKAYI